MNEIVPHASGHTLRLFQAVHDNSPLPPDLVSAAEKAGVCKAVSDVRAAASATSVNWAQILQVVMAIIQAIGPFLQQQPTPAPTPTPTPVAA